MKIAVCVPHYGPLNARFVACLCDLLSFTAGATINYNGRPVRPQIGALFEENGPLDYKRTRLVRRAQEIGVDYIQWIDNDQTFPQDGTLRLAAHDLPIVGCNYIHRSGPPTPTALGLDGRLVETTDKTHGRLESVAVVGFGFCLMKTQVFNVIPPPWFTTEMTPQGEILYSDDATFDNRARAVGIPVHLDHGVSLEVGHIGEIIRLNTEVEGINVSSTLSATGTE